MLIGSPILILEETQTMFDLNNLEFIGGRHGFQYVNRDRLHYSFVGIKRDETTGKLQFWLPLGFDDFNNHDFELVKSFFFRMYKTFKLYLFRKKYGLDEYELDNQRDGLYEREGGFAFRIEDREEVILYAKLNSLDKILEGYDELKISSLAKKLLVTSDLDYSKIYRYLHKAVYLDDDIAFLDEIQLKKSIVRPDHPPIVQIFCFIYTELKKELEELETVDSLAIDLAREFKEVYLNLESSLFDENNFQDTVLRLKDLLEESLLYTPYKDEDFWHFYEAVEAFLYGENDFSETDDVYWGISNFYDVWEDLCQFYMLNALHPFRTRLLYADIKGRLKDFLDLKPASFQLQLDASLGRRTIRPDLVFFSFPKLRDDDKKIEEVFRIETFNNSKYIQITLLDDKFRELYFDFWRYLIDPKKYDSGQIEFPKHWSQIRYGILDHAKSRINMRLIESQKDDSMLVLKVIDYKYMSELAFCEYSVNTLNEDGKNKVQDDIKKQLIYEWTLQKNFPLVNNFPHSFDALSTESEFWIPYFSEEEDGFLTQKEVDVQNENFNQSKIKVIKVNFQTLQNFYITI